MIITIASFKGGVGKTTTALHLADWLSVQRRIKSVVLADSDPNATALKWYQRGAQKNFVVLDADADLDTPNHLVIDTPARTSPAELGPMLAGSGLVIVPTNCSAFSLEATVDTLINLKIDDSKFAVLLTMVPTRGTKREAKARAALDAIQIPVFDAVIHDRVVFEDAELAGETTRTYRSGAAAWADYDALGNEIKKGWLK
jgi:chromosome partitioning protein